MLHNVLVDMSACVDRAFVFGFGTPFL